MFFVSSDLPVLFFWNHHTIFSQKEKALRITGSREKEFRAFTENLKKVKLYAQQKVDMGSKSR